MTRPGINFYRHRRIAEDVTLLTVDSGDWKLVSGDEFDAVRTGRVSDPSLLAEWKEAFLYLDEANWPDYLEKLKKQWSEVFSPPALHIVVVTPQCNLRCIYCHAGLAQSQDGQMTLETAAGVLDRILETPLEEMTLEIQGGEPTLNFPVVQFLIAEGKRKASACGKRLLFCIVSNFSVSFTDEMMRFLIENDVSVSTSIDGPREIHEANRNWNCPGGFDILRERVAAFRTIWRELRSDEPELSILLTATRAVLSKARETVDTYLELGFRDFFLRPVNPIGRGGQQTTELSYPPKDFVGFWAGAIDYILELYAQGTLVTEGHLCILLKKIFLHDRGYLDLRFPCGASFGQRAYHYDGTIYSCDEGRMLNSPQFNIGHIADASGQINENPNGLAAFTASLSELSYCEFCAYKPFCGVCPILNWKESGHLVTSVYGTRRCRIYRGMLDEVFQRFLNNAVFQKYAAEVIMVELR